MCKISVIMPVYNGEKYLKESIDSILNQTFSDFEFIIINDGSIDNTKKIINDYKDKRIVYIENEKNSGIVTTLNKGLNYASGKYIARMDADDISLPTRFEKQIKYMEENNDVDILGTAIELFGKNITPNSRIFSKSFENIKCDLLISCALAHPTVMIRKSILEIENYKYNSNYEKLEDYELWFQISKKYKIETLEEILLRYRIHSNQITQNYSEEYLERFKSFKKEQLNFFIKDFNSEELDIFCSLCLGTIEVNEMNINLLLNLFDKIISHNNSSKYFNIIILKKYFKNIMLGLLYKASFKDKIRLFNLIHKKIDISLSENFKFWINLIRQFLELLFFNIKRIVQIFFNQLKLKNKSFTIISNNCWAGFIYQKYGLRYNTPTIGCFFIGSDYVKFCKNLKYYLNKELTFITFESSKNYELIKGSPNHYPIGLLDDIEIYFMHYSSEKEALEKWRRRTKRINYDNILYKMSEREGYTKEDVIEFLNLPYKYKVCFSHSIVPNSIVISDLKDYIGDEITLTLNYFDELKMLNSMGEKNER